MNKVDVQIKKVRVLNISPKTKQIYLNILFESSGNSKEILKYYPLTTSEQLIHNILLDIRNKEKQENASDEEDEIFSGIIMVNILNQETTEEKLSYFFKRLNDGMRELAKTKISDNYLDKYVALRGAEITI